MIDEGMIINQPAGFVDVMPTICDIMGRDNDTLQRTHGFSEPDMIYINNMGLQEYELCDLGSDIYQDYNMIDTHPAAGTYIKLIDDKSLEIHREGYSREELPPATGPKRIKTDWVRYTRRSVQPTQ